MRAFYSVAPFIPFLYVASRERGGVLASTGRDGRADVEDRTGWFGRAGPADRIHGVFDADLVVVNGEWRTVAGRSPGRTRGRPPTG